MKKLFFLILVLFINSLSGGIIDDKLKQVSLNDRLAMKEFVKINFQWNQFAHVVYFDNKPMSLAATPIRSNQVLFMDTLWRKGWQAFKRNEHLFHHPNFIFNAHLDKYEKDAILELFIINKKMLQKCVTQHLNIFREILGEGFNYESFLEKLEENYPLCSLIQNNELLLGILLGYGEESCKAYQAMRTKYKGSIPPHTDTYCGIEIKSPNLHKICPVGYMGNPQSPEVQKLAATYEQELATFWQAYRKEDPLVFFLECICR